MKWRLVVSTDSNSPMYIKIHIKLTKTLPHYLAEWQHLMRRNCTFDTAQESWACYNETKKRQIRIVENPEKDESTQT